MTVEEREAALGYLLGINPSHLQVGRSGGHIEVSGKSERRRRITLAFEMNQPQGEGLDTYRAGLNKKGMRF